MYTPEEALLIKKAMRFANDNDNLFLKHAKLKQTLVQELHKQAGLDDTFKSTDVPVASNMSLKKAPRKGSFLAKFKNALNISRLSGTKHKSVEYGKALKGLKKALGK